MPGTMFLRSPHKDEAMQALRDGMGIKECAVRFGLSEKTVKRYQQEIDQKGRTQVAGQETKLGVVTLTKPAPYVIEFGQHKIDIDPEPIIESYILYSDMKEKLGLKDPFSEAIRDAMGMVWQLLISQPAVRGNKVIVEVKNGGAQGQVGAGVHGEE